MSMVYCLRWPKVRLFFLFFLLFMEAAAQPVTLQQATIVNENAGTSVVISTAATVLAEETAKRSGLAWKVTFVKPAQGDVVILRLRHDDTLFKPESFRISGMLTAKGKVIVIEGEDERGLMFGVGQLLRQAKFTAGSVRFDGMPSVISAPDKQIRGHQLGYRNTANSYDAWTKAQFEQYIRDLVVFGTNSIESIPIFDESTSPHFKVPPMEMNAFISDVCRRYGLDYWMWIPAQFDVRIDSLRWKYLKTFEEICKKSVRIDGVFFPGGDPGSNPPEQVMPLLDDLYAVLRKYHPKGKVWLSLQGFDKAQCQYVYRYIREKLPEGLGGLVTGPSSPTPEETRPELPARYRLRHYPDLTHNVRCEFEVPWLDPAIAMTLGREAVNPRPYQYAAIYRTMDPYIDGFLSYSDGVHDDVNKIIWTRMAWNRNSNERDVLREYANYFFNARVMDAAADGILALEKNWQGPIEANGGIATTLMAWKESERANPDLAGNWRWQMCLLRAYYDAYIRLRKMNETLLEAKVDGLLTKSGDLGADISMQAALLILASADSFGVMSVERKRVIALCEDLYRSIGLQTSVKKYKASGLERGAVLDFLDRPLNDRWWLEDEFKKIASLSEKDKVARLQEIGDWEKRAPGNFYDVVGDVGRSPHEMKGEDWRVDPTLRKNINPGYDWSDNGMSRKRISWLTNMRWPSSVEYTQIDTGATYLVRINGKRESLLKINGRRVQPSRYGLLVGDIKEFPVPAELVKQGKLVLTWEDINEDQLNWREQSTVSEVWLIRSGR